MPPDTQPSSSDGRIETSGWSHTRLKPWHKDRRYTEVWVSHDGQSWTMLGMEKPR